MQINEYSEDAPGRLVRSVMGHWTFEPNPLPPVIAYSAKLVEELSKADRALGELAGAGRMLPNPHLLIRPFIRREAVLSSRIEGTITQLDQLFLFEAEPDHVSHPSDAEEVRNYVHAIEQGLNEMRKGMPFTLQLLRDVHRVLLTNVRGGEKNPGQIRNRAVMIGRTPQFEEARFVPPCHTKLEPFLQDFIRFMREERTLPIVIQLALMHYQFETIHPFNDGNGRVGRLLITLMLCERGVLPEPLLYLSAYLEKNRQEYYDRLLNVSRKSEWEQWFLYFARGVAEQAQDAITRTKSLLELWNNYRNLAAKNVRSAFVFKIIDELFSSPYITINHAVKVSGVAFKNASRVIKQLEEAGILREVTGNARNRVYCADRVYQLLDAPISGSDYH